MWFINLELWLPLRFFPVFYYRLPARNYFFGAPGVN